MDIRFRVLFLSIALFLVGLSAIVLGGIKPPRVDYLPPPGLQLEKSYCDSVGDDNCDGIVMDYESGWERR